MTRPWITCSLIFHPRARPVRWCAVAAGAACHAILADETAGVRCAASVFAETDILQRDALWRWFRFVRQPHDNHFVKSTRQLRSFTCLFVSWGGPIAGIAPLHRKATQRCYAIDR